MTTVSLDSPLTLKNGAVIKNRFFKSAMSEQLGDSSHNPVPGLATVYRRWAEGGVGLNISGNIMVDRTALGEPKNVVLDEQSDLEGFRRWASAATANGTHFWAQLNHPGKQIPAFLNKEPVGPSAIPLGTGLEKVFNTPRALTEPEILEVIGKYVTAAKLAKEAGFTGVQIHGAHGYLVSQFLSSRHNQRTDQWGGSLENRMRFVLEIYKGMRAALGDGYPVGIKLNSADFMKGGFTEEESMQVVKALADAGIDLIEISGGTYENPSMMGSQKNRKESTVRREAYFLAYAEQVRKLVDTPLVVTGGFRSSVGMQDALSSGATDMVGLARPFALVPDLPNRAIQDSDYSYTLRNLTTGFKTVDRMTGVDLVWYEQQIHLMADGKDPKPALSPWKAVWATVSGMGYTALKKRRA
ncbi:NADH:flavin oxidoreductase/NADH oxidase family protein [Parendozoicomonas haliclonae]|uniref:NADH oxidase n=1 Tax=Parendozoicomonas haliclonae TaxID=1960125 RepID=A0A1X7AG73_9GAMM|nr:NADH:flavin oxidoreductase/NADH oxidase family protein [Parendozoicomonas haliclonae]SMA37518.1 NADH oxidase [Parendozoicomonas haliclonae]